MATIDIRILTANEIEEALPDLCAVLSDCVEGGASVGFLLPFTAKDAQAFWKGVATAVRAGATVLFVAVQAREVVGTVQLGIGLPPNQPHRADVKKLLVTRKARGLGLARTLMAAAEDDALRRGRHVLVLDTATGSPAEAIYAKLGWQRVGVIPKYALMPDGSFCDSTFFCKDLTSE